MGRKRWSERPKDQTTRWTNHVDVLELKDNKWVDFRLVGYAQQARVHWVETKTKKKFPIFCPDFNLDTEELVPDSEAKCDACKKEIGASYFYIQNIIVRRLQKKEQSPKDVTDPSKIDTDFRTVEDVDELWSPIKVLRFPKGVGTKIANTMSLMTNDEGKPCDPADPVEGYDLSIMYNSKAESAGDKYSVSPRQNTPLTEEELTFRLFNLDIIEPTPPSEVTKALQRNGYMDDIEEDDEDDEDDVPATPPVTAIPKVATKPTPEPAIEAEEDSPEPAVAPATKVEGQPEGVPDDCNDYGKFTGKAACFTSCKAKAECAALSEDDDD